MKKKILALFMAVILTLQLTGCNVGDDRSNTTVESDAKTSIKDLFHSAVGKDSEKPDGDVAQEESTSEPG